MHLLHENNVATERNPVTLLWALLNKVATRLPLRSSYLASPLAQIHAKDALRWFPLDHLSGGLSQYIHIPCPLLYLANVHTAVDAPSFQRTPLFRWLFP